MHLILAVPKSHWMKSNTFPVYHGSAAHAQLAGASSSASSQGGCRMGARHALRESEPSAEGTALGALRSLPPPPVHFLVC